MDLQDITLDVRGSPADVLSSWSRGVPVAAWGVGPDANWSRWAIIAPVVEARTIRVVEPAEVELWFPKPSGASLDTNPDHPRFRSGWLGWMSYDVGEVIEPKAKTVSRGALDWPLAMFQRCEGAWCFDKLRRRWWATGECVGRLPPNSTEQHESAALALAIASGDRDRYCGAVDRVIEYIRAGDVYQVNLARRLVGEFTGGLLSAFADLVRGAAPWYGSYLCDTHGPTRRAVLSASPELFLSIDPGSREIFARPMKGTRPLERADELRDSAKDRAELAMIVDLMRNDLGRVCELGSVVVDDARTIETHGALSQAVATVRGRIQDGRSLGGLVAACFPPGSVTGAPKIRAMQIIDELEGNRRGPYCGCVGYVSDSGHAEFSVSIRTLMVSGEADSGQGADAVRSATAQYWVGAGIVADSTPDEEWKETVAKTSALRSMSAGVTMADVSMVDGL